MGMHPNMWGRVWHHMGHPALRCAITAVLLSVHSHFRQFCGGHTSDTPRPKCIILFADVTSLKGTVMSYMTSQSCMCVGHMTFYYKRSANTSVGVLACCSSIHQVRLYHQRPTDGWCLMCVGCDVSSMSQGWSLLPSTVIIVLALVNSAVSPVGTSSISTRPGSAALLPVSTTSTGLLHLSVGAHVHCGRSDTEKYHVWPLPCAHHFQCVTYVVSFVVLYVIHPESTYLVSLCRATML